MIELTHRELWVFHLVVKEIDIVIGTTCVSKNRKNTNKYKSTEFSFNF